MFVSGMVEAVKSSKFYFRASMRAGRWTPLETRQTRGNPGAWYSVLPIKFRRQAMNDSPCTSESQPGAGAGGCERAGSTPEQEQTDLLYPVERSITVLGTPYATCSCY
jgi:hypothetical protein